MFYPNSFPDSFGIFLTVLFAVSILYLAVKHRKGDIFLLLCMVPLYMLFERMSVKAMRHILPMVPFMTLALAVFFERIESFLKNRWLAPLLAGLLCLFQIIRIVDYHGDLAAQDPRVAAAEWIIENIPQKSALIVESFPPFSHLAQDRDYVVYAAEWTEKSLTKRDELNRFTAKHDSVFYIADDFTRQIFSWKYTIGRYPEITRDRLDFYEHLSTQADRLISFESKHTILQPTITVYNLSGPPWTN